MSFYPIRSTFSLKSYSLICIIHTSLLFLGLAENSTLPLQLEGSLSLTLNLLWFELSACSVMSDAGSTRSIQREKLVWQVGPIPVPAWPLEWVRPLYCNIDFPFWFAMSETMLCLPCRKINTSTRLIPVIVIVSHDTYIAHTETRLYTA